MYILNKLLGSQVVSLLLNFHKLNFIQPNNSPNYNFYLYFYLF